MDAAEWNRIAESMTGGPEYRVGWASMSLPYCEYRVIWSNNPSDWGLHRDGDDWLSRWRLRNSLDRQVMLLRGHMVGAQLRMARQRRLENAYHAALAPFLKDALRKFEATKERTRKFLQKRGILK